MTLLTTNWQHWIRKSRNAPRERVENFEFFFFLVYVYERIQCVFVCVPCVVCVCWSCRLNCERYTQSAASYCERSGCVLHAHSAKSCFFVRLFNDSDDDDGGDRVLNVLSCYRYARMMMVCFECERFLLSSLCTWCRYSCVKLRNYPPIQTTNPCASATVGLG